MILMAINNLYQKCDKREGKTALKYPVMGKEEPKNFDKWKQRAEFAEDQIKIVLQYMKDFSNIIQQWEQDKKDSKAKPHGY